jgi:hypothetical protein
LRIPSSHNVKCKEEKIDSEVKILQEWDGIRPDHKLMLGSFYSHLVAKRIEEDKRREELAARFPFRSDDQDGVITYWIEKLLDTPLEDYRQRARDLIIIPYLIVRRGITDPDEIEATVMRWADKCNELEPLNPKYRQFEKDMRRRIRLVMRDMIPPMSFDKMREENPELAKMLKEIGK